MPQIKVVAQTVLAWQCWRMDRRTDGRYQTYYPPCFAIDKEGNWLKKGHFPSLWPKILGTLLVVLYITGHTRNPWKKCRLCAFNAMGGQIPTGIRYKPSSRLIYLNTDTNTHSRHNVKAPATVSLSRTRKLPSRAASRSNCSALLRLIPRCKHGGDAPDIVISWTRYGTQGLVVLTLNCPSCHGVVYLQRYVKIVC